MRISKSRLMVYAAELKLCFLMGADNKNRFRLALDTYLFHIANGFSIRRSYQSKAQTYHIVLGGQILPLQLRLLGGDFFVFHEIFLSEAYRLPAWYRPKSPTIIDLGANIGLTTLYYSRLFPDATFICVEPDSANTSLLHKNLISLAERLIVIEGAVSDHTGRVYFTTYQASWGGKITQNTTQSIEKPCYSMADILNYVDNRVIDLLKIDIEGAEEMIFADSCQWLDRVQMIIIELHSESGATNFRRAVHEAGFYMLEPDESQGVKMLIAYKG